MVWLPSGSKSVMIYSAVLIEYWRVTDRRTDRHRATAESELCIALHGKNV